MAYTKTDWVNGVTKVNQGNLNNNEDGTKTNDDKLVNTFSADINAYFGNTKLGDDFQDETLWTNGIADTANVKIGDQSLKLIEVDNIASTIATNIDNITLDFTEFNDTSISNDDDYIYFVFFVSNVSLVLNVRIFFDQSPTFTGANVKSFFITSGMITGWNFFKIKKDDFSTSGTGAWDNIQSIDVRWGSLANAQNEFVSFQLIQLVKKDPLSLIPNPFQRFGVRDFVINSGEWFVGKEFDETVWKFLQGSSGDIDSLQTNINFGNFIINASIQSGGSNDVGYVGWKINDLNNIFVQIINNVLRLTLREGGVFTDFSQSLNISTGDFATINITKNNGNVSVFVYINNKINNTININALTSLSGNGNLIIGTFDGSTEALYKSVSITEISHAHHSDISETTRDTRISDLIQSHTNIEWLGGTW